jgi:hypothetical protein
MSVGLSGVEPAMVALGAWHGVNPAMGWLFAVALGLQERRGSAVWRALPPLALGHGLAIGGAVLAALAAGIVVGPEPLKWVVAATLLVFGLSRLIRARHPRWVGMRVGFRDLVVWSTLMASAHGAGLMVIPWILSAGASHHAGSPPASLVAAALHTGAYLGVTALAALTVYYWLGVSWLRTMWVNLDLVWGVALIATGIATPFL